MKKLFFKASKIEGRGMFTSESAKKGEFIASIRGPIIRRIEKTKKDALALPDLIGISGIYKSVWVDPKPPFKYLNHSCQPNVGINGRRIHALRDIHAGDEIVFDYSTVVANPLWEMRCLCKERNCRKLIRSIQYLPITRYQSYLPYIPSDFKKVYLRYTKSNAH
jgi:SET domain-containing protein